METQRDWLQESMTLRVERQTTPRKSATPKVGHGINKMSLDSTISKGVIGDPWRWLLVGLAWTADCRGLMKNKDKWRQAENTLSRTVVIGQKVCAGHFSTLKFTRPISSHPFALSLLCSCLSTDTELDYETDRLQTLPSSLSQHHLWTPGFGSLRNLTELFNNCTLSCLNI